MKSTHKQYAYTISIARTPKCPFCCTAPTVASTRFRAQSAFALSVRHTPPWWQFLGMMAREEHPTEGAGLMVAVLESRLRTLFVLAGFRSKTVRIIKKHQPSTFSFRSHVKGWGFLVLNSSGCRCRFAGSSSVCTGDEQHLGVEGRES